MTHILIRCPHCKKMVRQTTGGAYEWGSPLRVCKKCGKGYVDKTYHEVAIEGFSRYEKIKSSWWALILPLFFVILYSIVYPVLILLGLGLVVIMCLGINNSYKKNQQEMVEEMERSKARLSNYDYAFTLKNVGYDVPGEYLKLPEGEKNSVHANYQRYRETQNTEADLFQEIKEDEIEIIRPKIIKNENDSSEALDLGNNEKQLINENDIIDNGIDETTDYEKTEESQSIESNEEIAFCRKCGTQLLKDSEFCHKCGCEKVR